MNAPCGWVTSNYPAMRHDLCLGLPQYFCIFSGLDLPADYLLVRTFVIMKTLSPFISLPPV